MPTTAFFSLTQAAARWDCRAADIAGWAAAGKLQIMASFAPVACGGSILAGLLEVPMADIHGAFTRVAPGCGTVTVFRLRPPNASDWVHLPSSAGVPLHDEDLLITRAEAERFEEAHEIFERRPTVVVRNTKSDFDWDGATVWLVKRIHDHGVPGTKGSLADEMADWFSRRSPDGAAGVPDLRSIRLRIMPFWHALNIEAPHSESV
ncbi:hypothetical protein LAZ29_15815 [Cereibacter sphaeroides]|uniref:hypothetical protein n=1 Tax=Cereibacter sphaeroides TaxID=1063 RepID=UPI001F2B475B|nr:hypothetical protein [Cereibacter sphaeroides]MCE6952401.1 hypothetical protein [Cereibacter sphaeroides]